MGMTEKLEQAYRMGYRAGWDDAFVARLRWADGVRREHALVRMGGERPTTQIPATRTAEPEHDDDDGRDADGG